MKTKSAFTMIELVFVIVVLGILASLAMGRMDRDIRQEAASNILSHIRLTQQLALRDNKHRSDNDVKWQRAYWQWRYVECRDSDDIYYQITSDSNLGGGTSQQSEAALDPIDGKYIFLPTVYCKNRNKGNNNSENVAVTEKYGITNVVRTGGCASGDTRRYIAFDYLGRPHHGEHMYSSPNFNNIITSDCNMTFILSTDEDNDNINNSFTITINAETGHAYIVGEEDL